MTEERYNNENDGKVQIFCFPRNIVGDFLRGVASLKMRFDFEFKTEESKTGDAFWKLK